MRPEAFACDFVSEWCVWAMDNGLPELPDMVALGEAVPVAVWTDEDLGAVTVISRDTEVDDPVHSTRTDVDTYCFKRTADGWDQAGGYGGTNWALGARLARLPLARGEARFTGSLLTGNDGWQCIALDLEVGSDATQVEVEMEHRRITRPLAAPLGVGVVCLPWPTSAVVKVLTREGIELARTTFRRSPGRD